MYIYIYKPVYINLTSFHALALVITLSTECEHVLFHIFIKKKEKRREISGET